MKKLDILTFLFIALLTPILSGFSERQEKEEILFEEATQLISEAKKRSFGDAHKLNKGALEKLEIIMSEHGTSALAIKLNKGELKVRGRSFSEFKNYFIHYSYLQSRAETDPLIFKTLLTLTKADPAYREFALMDVTQKYESRGQAKEADIIMLTVAKSLTRFNILKEKVKTYKIQDQNKAAAIAILKVLNTDTPRQRHAHLPYYARNLFELGEKEEAMNLLLRSQLEINDIGSDYFKTFVSSKIAASYQLIGESEIAKDLFVKVEQKTKSLEMYPYEAHPWTLVIDMYTDAGLLDRGYKALLKMRPLRRIRSMESFIRAALLSKNPQKAIAFNADRDDYSTEAQVYKTTLNRAKLTLDLIAYYLDFGKITTASELLNDMLDEVFKGHSKIYVDQNHYIHEEIPIFVRLSEIFSNPQILPQDKARIKSAISDLKISDQRGDTEKMPLVFTRLGLQDKSNSYASKIFDPNKRSKAYLFLARYLGKNNQIVAAKEALMKAEDSERAADELLGQFRPGFDRETSLPKIAVLYIELGDKEKAINLLEKIPAMAFMSSLGSRASEIQPEVFVGLAKGYQRLGFTKKAIEFLGEAKKVKGAEIHQEFHANVLPEIIKIFIAMQSYDQALEVIISMHPYFRLRVWVSEIEQLLLNGNPVAHKWGKSIIHRTGREPTEVPKGLVPLLLKLGHETEALRLLESLENASAKSIALAGLSVVYQEQGNKKRSNAFIEKLFPEIKNVSNPIRRIETILQIVELIKSQKRNTRTTLLENAEIELKNLKPLPRQKAFSWHLVHQLIASNYYGEALSLGEQLDKNVRKLSLLEQVIRAYLDSGQKQNAEALLKEALVLEDLDQSSKSNTPLDLSRLAPYFVKVGDKATALRLLANSLKKIDSSDYLTASDFFSAAETLIELGRMDKALEIIEKAGSHLIKGPNSGWGLAIDLGVMAYLLPNIKTIEKKHQKKIEEILHDWTAELDMMENYDMSVNSGKDEREKYVRVYANALQKLED